MTDRRITGQEAAAIKNWIGANKGKGLTDDTVGNRAYQVGGEVLAIKTAVGEDGRTWGIVASPQMLRKLSASNVLEPKRK